MDFNYAYEQLVNSLLGMRDFYKSYTPRYSIRSPDALESELQEFKEKELNDLAIEEERTRRNFLALLSRVNEHVIQCDTKRLTARDVITKISQELGRYVKGESIEGSMAELNVATGYLLGALIHRHLRISEVYSDWGKPLSLFSIFGKNALASVGVESNPENCRLNLAIKNALERALDPYTILSSLKVFYNVMRTQIPIETVDAEGKKTTKLIFKYQTFEHFSKTDLKFEENIKYLIEQYEELCKDKKIDYDIIYFIETLTFHLESTRSDFDKEISIFCANLKIKDFKQLTAEQLSGYFNHYIQAKPMKEHIQTYLPKKEITSKLFSQWFSEIAKNITDINALEEVLKIKNRERAHSQFCGAYYLLLKTIGPENPLVALFYLSIGFEEKATANNWYCYLNNLNAYLTDTPKPFVCNLFVNGNNMMKKIKDALEDLEPEINELRVTANSM